MAIDQEILKKYKNLNWKDLLRENLGESGRLTEIAPNLKRIKAILEKVLSYSATLEQLPRYQQSVQTIINNFVDSCNNEIINNYNDVTQRPSKVEHIRRLEESLVDQLSPILNYIQLIDPTNNARQQDLDKKSQDIEVRLKDLDILTEKVQSAVQVSGRIAEKQEVDLYGKEFEIMAEGSKSIEGNKAQQLIGWYNKKGNKQRAFTNQSLMILTLLVTMTLACIFVFGKQIDWQGNDNFALKLWNVILEQNVLLKIFLLSAGGYLVAHFSRNYSAEMNMYYMNKHRQMALNSHQRILDAVRKTETQNEAETKNAILLQVAKTMFDIQETGYLKHGNSPVPTTQIIETVRSGISNN